jgi:anti-sigma B factor antagonist
VAGESKYTVGRRFVVHRRFAGPDLPAMIGRLMTTFDSPRRPPMPAESPRPRTPFNVEIEPDRDRVIVIPEGELDLATVDRLGAAIDGLVDAGFRTLVLDLRRLTFMDSTGLCLILRESRRPDVAIHLIDGAEVVARLFDVCGVRDRLTFTSPRVLRLRG